VIDTDALTRIAVLSRRSFSDMQPVAGVAIADLICQERGTIEKKSDLGHCESPHQVWLSVLSARRLHT